MKEPKTKKGMPIIPELLSIIVCMYILVDAFSYKSDPDNMWGGLYGMGPILTIPIALVIIWGGYLIVLIFASIIAALLNKLDKTNEKKRCQ